MRGPPTVREPLSREGLSFPEFVEPCTKLSAEDARALETLPVSGAREIELWALATGEQDPLYIAALNARRNYVAPIHRYLPIELLMNILLLAGRAWPGLRSPLKLLHVCRHWRSILLHASEFWADMLALPPVYRRPEFVEVLLRRSGSQTFQLKPVLLGRELLHGDMLAPHLHRISYLRLPPMLMDRELHALVSGSQFRSLQVLHLSPDRSLSALGGGFRALMSLDDPPIEAALPCLRDLTTPFDLLPYLAAQSLERLSILSPSESASPPRLADDRTNPLAVALRRCSRRLRWLAIAPNILPAQWAPSKSETPLDLPTLQYLRILDVLQRPIQSFLEHTQYPLPVRMYLGHVHHPSVPNGPWHVEGRLRSLLPERLSVSVIDTADRLHILTYPKMHGQYSLQTFRDDRELLTVRPNVGDVTGDVLRIFSGANSIRTLRLMLEAPDTDVPNVHRVLDAFPQLTDLQLGNVRIKRDGWATLLNSLANASPSESSVAVVCPNLETLALIKERLDRPDLEKAEGETAEVVATVLEERQKQLGRPLRSFVLAFIPRQLPFSTPSYEVDAAVNFYAARLLPFVQSVSTTTYRQS